MNVEITLKHDAEIPEWVKGRSDLEVKISYCEDFFQPFFQKDMRYTCLKISDAEAYVGEKYVNIKMSKSGELLPALSNDTVLGVLNYQGEIVKNNWSVCTKCKTLTEFVVDKWFDVSGSKMYIGINVSSIESSSITCKNCKYRLGNKRL